MTIKIGVDTNTNENIILTQESRSKCVAIIGPTSSGKISLGILPMVNEDIKSEKGILYVGENKNLCDAILSISREEGREYVYIDLNGDGTDSFNVFKLFSEEFKISKIVDKSFVEAYTVYLSKKLGSIKKASDILEKSMAVISTFLGVLKEFKGEDMTMRDLYSLSKDDSDLVDLVFMGYEKIKEPKRKVLVEMFKKWHESTYCNKQNDLYENTKYFRQMLESLMEVENVGRTIIHGNLPQFDLLNSINKNTVIVIKPLSEENESAIFVNHLICSIVALISQLKGTEETNIYLHNCAKYISNDFVEMVNQKRLEENSSKVGIHIIEETFNLEDGEKEFIELIQSSANIILFPGCTKKDEAIFNDIVSEFSKKEIKAIGDVRLAKFKTATAKLLEENNATLRKLELSFVD